MDSIDNSAFNNVASTSRLLSESPPSTPYQSSSHNGAGGDDLSLSELSLGDHPPDERPFSLFAQQQPPPATSALEERNEEGGLGDGRGPDGSMEDEQDEEKRARLQVRLREEKLQNDLFVLRKLNSAFAVYNDALKEKESGTERVSAQLEQTNALLNKYVNMLSRSERITRLLFDERWEGVEADEDIIEQEAREAEDRRLREEEERALVAKRERERREREEAERQAREEKVRLEQEKKDRLAARSTSGVRGVRGTRAQMRGAAARGTSRAGAPTSRASPAASGAPTTQKPTIGRSSALPRGSSIARPATQSKRT